MNATVLMVMGMVSVFIVLLLVVLGGNMLINIVNKYTRDLEIIQTPNSIAESTEISKATLAAITAAVLQVTGGKGHIVEVIKKK